MRVKVGTSGYDYAEWKGAFYPATLEAKRRLEYYAEHFRAVEINATFYRMPAAETLARWSRATPADFTFALKAPQRITHVARLRDVDGLVGAFVDVARTLGPKLGPLLFQLPPSMKKDVGRLVEFLGLLPRDLAVALEFRHPSWFSDDVLERLRVHRVALCIAETEAGATPAVATGEFGYLRLRAVDYSERDLRRWVETLARLGAGWREAFVFFKHEAAATGPALARQLASLLAAAA